MVGLVVVKSDFLYVLRRLTTEWKDTYSFRSDNSPRRNILYQFGPNIDISVIVSSTHIPIPQWHTEETFFFYILIQDKSCSVQDCRPFSFERIHKLNINPPDGFEVENKKIHNIYNMCKDPNLEQERLLKRNPTHSVLVT